MRLLELKIPPVGVFLLVGGAMWLLADEVPDLRLGLPLRDLLPPLLVAVGGGFGLAGIAAFARARTSVDPMNPDKASTVVDSGIYRFTRNPMYVGLLFVLLAWAFRLDSPVAFAGPPVFVLYMTRLQIIPEERVLAERFGEDYEAYRRRVRRWF